MSLFFFFNDTATTEIYTLSLHDALPISQGFRAPLCGEHRRRDAQPFRPDGVFMADQVDRSEEHTSELQSPCNLVCRLLLEKKKEYSRVTLGYDLPHSAHPKRSATSAVST